MLDNLIIMNCLELSEEHAIFLRNFQELVVPAIFHDFHAWNIALHKTNHLPMENACSSILHSCPIQSLSRRFCQMNQHNFPVQNFCLVQIFFNLNWKTCRIRRGYEQLSSSSSWRFMAKKGHANILAHAAVKGLNGYGTLCNLAWYLLG